MPGNLIEVIILTEESEEEKQKMCCLLKSRYKFHAKGGLTS
jgi:hypothetical protein